MPQGNFSIPIESVVQYLGLEQLDNFVPGALSFNVRCPVCGHKMNINTEKTVFNCYHCDTKGGVLDLYSIVKYGDKGFGGKSAMDLFKELIAGMGLSSEKIDFNRPRPAEIRPAEDKLLNEAYSALVSLPYLALTDAHKENLLRRGLTGEDIIRNSYASVPSSDQLLVSHHGAKDAALYYDCNNIEQIRVSNSALMRFSRNDLIAGMLIATDIEAKHISLKNVPGFFMLGEVMCYKYDAGMLVPTRNSKGEIVGFQTRRDTKSKNGLRYLTLSSKGLPEGPTAKISRTHYPLLNSSKITKSTYLILTEGPLKSDVALSLLRRTSSIQDIAFIAIQGVNNTSELKEIAKCMKLRGLTTIYTALDMDKTTNLNVAKAGRAINSIFLEEGISVVALVWDMAYANSLVSKLEKECEQRSISLAAFSSNPYYRINNMIQALGNSYTLPSEERWNSKTKGIDDYLLSKLNA